MLNVSELQRYMPAWMKYYAKRHYRTFFPNKLILLFNPTFRCNYRCSYCTVVTKFDFGTVFSRRAERPASDWLNAFEKLPSAMIYIAGGEPFMYAGLPEIINNLPAKHQLVGVVTNLSMNESWYRKVEKKIHMNASFHREFIEQDEFVAKIKALRDQFHIQVNIVATPENLPLIEQIDSEMARDNVTLHVDPYVDIHFHYSPQQRALLDRVLRKDRNPDLQLNFDDFSEKSCSGGRNYINVTPNGDVYTCNGGMHYIHSPIYAGFGDKMDVSQFAIGNLFEPGFTLRKSNIVCTLPCKDACDLDSVKIQSVGTPGRVAKPADLRVLP